MPKHASGHRVGAMNLGCSQREKKLTPETAAITNAKPSDRHQEQTDVQRAFDPLNWSIDVEELWDVARNRVPVFLTELRPLLDAAE